MLEKLDKIQELLKIPNVYKNPELAIANMKILNLLVSLRSDIEQLNLCDVSQQSELLMTVKKRFDEAMNEPDLTVQQSMFYDLFNVINCG